MLQQARDGMRRDAAQELRRTERKIEYLRRRVGELQALLRRAEDKRDTLARIASPPSATDPVFDEILEDLFPGGRGPGGVPLAIREADCRDV